MKIMALIQDTSCPGKQKESAFKFQGLTEQISNNLLLTYVEHLGSHYSNNLRID